MSTAWIKRDQPARYGSVYDYAGDVQQGCCSRISSGWWATRSVPAPGDCVRFVGVLGRSASAAMRQCDERAAQATR